MIATDVEPRQSEVVLAVQVGVLTPRVPPSALVVGRTVGRTVVMVAVFRAEPVPVLERQRVRGVSPVPGYVQPVTVRVVRYRETPVIGTPIVAVYIRHPNAQRRPVVCRQPVYGVVAEP